MLANGFIVLALFNILLYSYFYLWSAVLAWLVILVSIYLISDFRDLWKRNTLFLVFVTLGCLTSLLPYFYLIRQMGETHGVTVLEKTRTMILVNPSLIASYVLLAVTILALFTKRLDSDNKLKIKFLFAFLLVPLAVFNQQIITGYAMQPFHYERYAANYSVLIGFVLLTHSLFRRYLESRRVLAGTLLIASIFLWGCLEATFVFRNKYLLNSLIDESRPVNSYLSGLRDQKNLNGLTSINFEPIQGNTQPVLASVPVLWAFHINAFSDLTTAEYRNRLFRYLYFTGKSPRAFENELRNCPGPLTCSQVFTWRYNMTITIEDLSPASAEIENVIRDYAKFYREFDESKAYSPGLGFAIAKKNNATNNFSNLELWYVRDTPIYFGEFVLYRLEPKRKQ